MGPKPRPLADRLKARSAERSSGCLEWTGCVGPTGYGVIRTGSTVDGTRRTRLVPRVTWELEHGAIPPGLCVLHRCDNPRCMKLSHLFLGTPGDNAADRDAKNRVRHGTAHPMARLTDERVRQIRRARARGATVAEIATAHGVVYGTILKVLRGQTWKRVAEVA